MGLLSLGRPRSMALAESREDWILREAQRRPAAERSIFLDGACAGDEALRRRVESLLATAKPSDALTQQETKVDPLSLKLDRVETFDEAIGQMIGRYKILE